ncbi:secondary thiamine-phosphate synthase enzyme YjbQ [Robertkochia aurantiaca]|uniref:secondary thiamine-phosphate synthase enzyme YjbQ n=1 Tax=Robertkochia aurantiaca TaxID=2873700 RepID=UPI001CCC5AAF|nr:secondary thiamine-phosphate synthase enzyme YjbQ [Robertkochia sp. 3YJGBD-33]
MKIFQREIRLKPQSRGFHLITDEVVSALPELRDVKIGQLQIFIKHTSASLTVNENADATVRGDFERHFNVMVPENASYYRHTYEGPDDMPAHIKASLMGSSLLLPVTSGNLNLGTWQGIYLCEHRDNGGSRNLVLTLQGEYVES